MTGNWTFTELDRNIAAEIQDRLPPELFDVHAHLWRRADLSKPVTGLWAEGPGNVSIKTWRDHIGRQVGGKRLIGGLLIPSPTGTFRDTKNIPNANEYLFEQVGDNPNLKGLALVAPDIARDLYQALFDNPQFAGFKPYHLFSRDEPTFQSAISSFLPEWVWETAHERGLIITLHLVRDAALADPENLRYIRRYCARYPNARLILAHAARGFHAQNTVKAIAGLRGIENVWFDTSGVCEQDAFRAILHEFGPSRLLWGSDFPVSEIRGRCVTVGTGFAWLQPDTVLWEKTAPHAHPILVGLESIRALLAAVDAVCLDEFDLRNIFADNARRLLGLIKKSETRAQKLYHHAKQRIPGGTQLLSKRPEMLAPDQWPAYFREARGCEIWDLDGRHYYDMSTNGIGSCLLGFRDPDVTRAVQRRINLGSMCTLNPPEEVELADLLCDIHPWAEQVRFARCGGEACAVAVRIARAVTDRSIIAVCGYHGWQDWYLAANLGENDALRGHLLPGLSPIGVPGELRGTTASFMFNDREGFRKMLDQHGDKLAAVIMEPCRSEVPDQGFLEFVRDGANRAGALLIMDEITIGFRLNFGGAHLKLGVDPDMAVFAKALGNGHPMAAVIGARSAMSGAHESFISSTYWTESVGPVAALAVLRKMQEVDVPAHISETGARVQAFWKESARRHRLPVKIGGFPCLAKFQFEHEHADALRTFYTQLMLDKGFLAGCALYPTLAHTNEIVERYGSAIDGAFRNIAEAIDSGKDITDRLKGPVAHSGFSRLTS